MKAWLPLLMIILTTGISANPWKAPVKQLEKIWDRSGAHNFVTSPFNPVGAAFSLRHINRGSLDDRLKQLLQLHGLHPILKLNGTKWLPGTHFNLNESFSRNYNFVVGETAVCNYQMRVHKLAGVQNLVVMGKAPKVFDLSSMELGSLADAKYIAENGLFDRGINANQSQVLNAEKCLFVNDGTLEPAYKMVIHADGFDYHAIANQDQVFELTPRYFDVTGSAKVYDKNPKDGTLKSFTLNDLKGDGSLENSYFTTSTTGTKANESDHVFDYSISDGRFDETSVFVHATRQYEWFKSLGHSWSGDKLNLIVHAVISGSVNNALYTPGVGSISPKIQVGDGDGIRLQNLPKDGDVVSHELGHHIVYGTLQSVKGESLVIHEGLADFFTFTRTGDPCLAESICPKDSLVNCELESQCLRSADNDYVLGKNTKSEPHLTSQFISGMLWSLRGNGVETEHLEKIVFRGVQLLQQESGYADLILSFLLADKELYESKYCQTIYDKAKDRGLESHISAFSCDGELPSLGDKDGNSGETVQNSDSDSKHNKFPLCGTIVSAQGANNNSNLLLVLLLLLPLTILTSRLLAKDN